MDTYNALLFEDLEVFSTAAVLGLEPLDDIIHLPLAHVAVQAAESHRNALKSKRIDCFRANPARNATNSIQTTKQGQQRLTKAGCGQAWAAISRA